VFKKIVIISRAVENITDENLVKLVQDGDNEQFGHLVERYEAKMLSYARKFLFDSENAKDMVQEVFIKAYVNIASFDLSKKFSPWLYRIAHNCFINEIKKTTRERSFVVSVDVFFPELFSKDEPDREIIDNELRASLDDSISKVDIKYREVLVLYYFQELNYKEIADVLHIPVPAVGIRLSRGKKLLRKFMTNE